jgi:hypothetical protein
VAHKRFLLGVIFGVLPVVATVFIFDSLATKEDAAGAEPRQIVNWDVASDRLHEFTESIRGRLKKLTR